MNDKQLNTSPPRGMRDFLPEEAALRDWAAAVLVRTYEQFGFNRIETSTLEDINNLRRSEGGENLQLIFEVLKRGDKLKRELSAGNVDPRELADMGLRFDLTVPLVRFYAANQSGLLSPFKAIQIGYAWRAEAPQTQAGRFRQFTQCDIDILGLSSPVVEMELLQATATALLALGLEGCFFRINDRKVLSALVQYCGFSAAAYDSVWIALDKLDKIDIGGVERELDEITGSTTGGAPVKRLIGVLRSVQAAGDDFDRLCGALPQVPELSEVLQQLGIIINVVTQQSQGKYSIKFDPTLARGMGYYTGPIFEAGLTGYPSSIGGGGRYDKMIGKYLGRDVPACGFSIGFERAVSILLERGFVPPRPEQIALIYEPRDGDSGVSMGGAVLACAQRLRSKGLRVCVLPRKKEMRKQLDQLVAHGFKQYAVFKPDVDTPELKTLGQIE